MILNMLLFIFFDLEQLVSFFVSYWYVHLVINIMLTV